MCQTLSRFLGHETTSQLQSFALQKSTCVAQVISVQQGHRSLEGSVALVCLICGMCYREDTTSSVGAINPLGRAAGDVSVYYLDNSSGAQLQSNPYTTCTVTWHVHWAHAREHLIV